MNNISIETKADEKRRYYASNTDEGKLEKYLIENNIYQIGNPEEGSKLRTMENGDERYGGLSMDRNDRALRTLLVRKLEFDELEKIHNYEKRKMDRFLCFGEIKNLIRRHIKFEYKVDWHGKFADIVYKWMKRNRTYPSYKFYQGFKVKPYFLYDSEFDGMTYHHLIDKSVLNCVEPIDLSSLNKKNNQQFQEIFS